MVGELLFFNVQLHRSELANLEHVHIWELFVRTLEFEETNAGKSDQLFQERDLCLHLVENPATKLLFFFFFPPETFRNASLLIKLSLRIISDL